MCRLRLRALSALCSLSLVLGGPLGCRSLWQGDKEEFEPIPMEDEQAVLDPDDGGDASEDANGAGDDGSLVAGRGEYDPELTPELTPETATMVETPIETPVDTVVDKPVENPIEVPVENSITQIAPVNDGKFARLTRECFMHEGPQSASAVVRMIPQGRRVWVESAGEQWMKVYGKSGPAYVWSDCFAPAPAEVRSEIAHPTVARVEDSKNTEEPDGEQRVEGPVEATVATSGKEIVVVGEETKAETVAADSADAGVVEQPKVDEKTIADSRPVEAAAATVSDPIPPPPPNPIVAEAGGYDLGFGAGLGAGLILFAAYLGIRYVRRPRKVRQETMTYV